MAPPPGELAAHDRLPTLAEWKELVRRYEEPSTARAAWQIANTFVPYAAIWFLLHHFQDGPWWLLAILAAVAGTLLVRVFIVFHDCGHGSFFRSPLANDITGFVAGMLTFTPYYHWRWQHSLHHGTAGNLDRRGIGDVWTMTVREYLESSRWKRFAYRLSRNPIVLFVLAPLFLFLVRQRFPSKEANPRERTSVWWMNLAIVAMGAWMTLLFGFVQYLVLQSIVMGVAGAAGVWLFYVQHQFEDAYWERREDWDYTEAALKGSSYYRLPAVLRWLSGNIGYHHIHHLSSRIPNYHLKRCHESSPFFTRVKPLTFFSSLRSLKFRLWDERLRRLVGYVQVRREQARQRRENRRKDREPPSA